MNVTIGSFIRVRRTGPRVTVVSRSAREAKLGKVKIFCLALEKDHTKQIVFGKFSLISVRELSFFPLLQSQRFLQATTHKTAAMNLETAFGSILNWPAMQFFKIKETSAELY